MEKVLQEFRIIETDDGFRIEIKGDKDQLREWVMNLNPQTWLDRDHDGAPWRVPHFGPRWGRPVRARFWARFAPPGWGAEWDEDVDNEEVWAGRGRGRDRGRGSGIGRGRHGHHEHHHHHEHDAEDAAQA